MKNIFVIFLVINIILIEKSMQFTDTFNEELFVKPLASGHVNSYFQFTTKWDLADKNKLHHTHLVARPIAEIFLYYDIVELHISLTHGLWRYENWGYPPVDASPGAEIWAWFSGNLTEAELDVQWKNLCGTLSGLFCASLGFIDEANTLKPEFSFRPQFSDGRSTFDNKHVRYATLPREIVCTENLTPWKKLLPCSNQKGFTSLLNSGHIHSTNYHSLGLHMRMLSDAATPNESQLQIKQTVNLVFDKQIISPNRDWSLRKMFGQGLTGGCVLADTSKVYLDVTEQDFGITPEPDRIIQSQRGGAITRFAEFDIKTWSPNRMFNLAAVYQDKSLPVSVISPPPLYAKRFLLGVGQERGKILTKISNQHWTSLNAILHENIPWFVPVYLHTLKIKQDQREITPTAIHYIPGERRKRSYQLEVAVQIPARSTIEISIEFDYIFLKWLEYPPDANHGHYIGSAVLSAQLPVGRNVTSVPVDGSLFVDSFNASRPYYFIQIRTESLLISLPTPDFSMPYNVICLACTVVALAFGPIHNISTKRIHVPETEDKVSIVDKIKSLVFGQKKKADDTLGENKDDGTEEEIPLLTKEK